MEQMKNSFEPYVRYVSKNAYVFGDVWIVNRDCHMLYILEGSGKFEVGDTVYPLSPQTLIYWPYGCRYRITDYENLLFYTVNFDFSADFTDVAAMEPYREGSASAAPPLVSIPTAADEVYRQVQVLPRAVWAEDALRGIYEEQLRREEDYRRAQSLRMALVLIDIRRHMAVETGAGAGQTACEEAKRRIAADPCLNNRALAATMGYHPYYLNDLFRQHEGVTLHQYILRRRLMRAYEMITATALPLEKIALTCGFSSQAHFSRAFKAAYAFSPSRLRKRV